MVISIDFYHRNDSVNEERSTTAVCKNIEPFTALGARCQAYIQQHVHPESEDTTRVEALDIIKLMMYH